MSPAPEGRLDSWKEIAAHLKRSVRTARRWERQEGLPVHRHVHHVLGSVYAYPSEIDAWLRTKRGRPAGRAVARRRGPLSDREITSVAVLPFANLSTAPDDEYFADGLTDEVTADLARIRALRVISRTSTMRFKHTTSHAHAIARELGVAYLLEGTVRRAGERLRITARLIDAATDGHVWADKYDGRVSDVFTIQEGLARVIVEALKIRLTADEDRRLADRPIPNVHAYECYLRARHEGWRWRRDAIDQAIQLLRNGLDIVGDNAGLYAALGQAYLQYREAGADLSDRPLVEAEGCATKVFTLEPASASGLRLRAWIHYGRARIQEAVNDAKSALDIEPNDADTLLLLTNCYLISGRVAAARPLIDRLLAIDPLTPVTRCMPAFADAMEGSFATALEPYRQMFEMDPGNPMARLFYIWALALNHRSEAIGPVLETFPPEVRETIPARVAFFLAHAAAGDAVRAHAIVTPEIEAVATAQDVFPRMLAQGYALAGMTERTLHWLAIAVDRGFINYPFLAQHDPCFGTLRGERSFQTLLEEVRKRWERFEA